MCHLKLREILSTESGSGRGGDMEWLRVGARGVVGDRVLVMGLMTARGW